MLVPLKLSSPLQIGAVNRISNAPVTPCVHSLAGFPSHPQSSNIRARKEKKNLKPSKRNNPSIPPLFAAFVVLGRYQNNSVPPVLLKRAAKGRKQSGADVVAPCLSLIFPQFIRPQQFYILKRVFSFPFLSPDVN